MEKPKIKPEDIQSLNFIEKVTISPDKRFLALSIKQIKDYKYKSNIFVFDIDRTLMRQLTSLDTNDNFLCWHEDSERIFFNSNREKKEKQSIYCININGGEPEFICSQDDLNIIEWEWTGPNDALLICQKNEIQGLKHEDEIIYYEFDKPFYKADGKGYMPKGHPQLYKLDLKKKELKHTKSIDRPKSGLYYDNAKDTCYFITNIEKDMYSKLDHNEIISFCLKKGQKKTIKTENGPKISFNISPDKRFMAVISHFHPNEYSGSRNYELIVYDLENGNFKNATASIDNSVQNNTIADMEQTGWVKKPLFSKDSKHIFFNVSENASHRVYAYSIEEDRSTPLTETNYNIIDYDIGSDCIYAVVSFPDKPSEVYRIGIKDNCFDRLTSINEDFLNKFKISKPEHYTITNNKGFSMDYWIIKPPDFTYGNKYPLILNIHGGPHAQFANTFFFEFQVLCSAGYVLLYSNPTGSMGKGHEFAKRLENNWGVPDSEDISIILDKVLEYDFIDKDRVGVTGGSYGGFMTNRLLGTTDYFKTGITERCVSDLVSMAETSDFAYIMPKSFNGKFWKNYKFYWNSSPIRFVENIKVPLLIIHSDSDHRTPLGQAEAIYTAMKILKKKAKLIIFPGESHGLNRSGGPQKRVARLKLFIDWFRKYL